MSLRAQDRREERKRGKQEERERVEMRRGESE